jgi:hypothetical protein
MVYLRRRAVHTKVNKQALTAGAPPDWGYIELYEHVNFTGCSWRLLEWESHTEGDYKNLTAFGFLWWGWKSANDAVASVDVRVSADAITFFDDMNINLSGSVLWIPVMLGFQTL